MMSILPKSTNGTGRDSSSMVLKSSKTALNLSRAVGFIICKRFNMNRL